MSTESNIISTAASVISDSSIFMYGQFGDIKKDKSDDLINKDNNLYKRDQYDVKFETPLLEYNHISDVHTFKTKNSREITKDHNEYNPHMEYLHKKGLIGKNTMRYKNYYVNIDSANRNKHTNIKCKHIVKLDNAPLLFDRLSLRIYTQNTEMFGLNDKITISGVTEKLLTLRSRIVNDYGETVNYFLMEPGKRYMTVNADNNMNIDVGFTPDIRDNYSDMMIEFKGFIGDKKTEWCFDMKNYLWDFTPVFNHQTTSNHTIAKSNIWCLKITEDVLGVTTASSSEIEFNQIKSNMLIAEILLDHCGTVIEIRSDIPYRSDDIRWTTPVNKQYVPPIGIPETYYADAITALTLNGLDKLPSIPTTIYKVLDYFDKVQNIIRPIFLREMTKVPNFILRYQDAKKIYATIVRIIMPETTKITTSSMIGNMAVNMLNSIHRMYLTSADVERDIGIYNTSTTTSTDVPISNKFYIKLGNDYSRRRFEFSNPFLTGILLIKVYEESIFDVTIRYHHHGGVPLKYINCDYINGFNNIDTYKYIRDIVPKSYIVIEMDRIGFLNRTFGGDSVHIGLIEDIDRGYSNPNSYIIDLERVYNNVISIRMISSCFPITQKVIMDGLTGGKRNNRFYWQNIDDGDRIYKIELQPGNYSRYELREQFEKEVKNIQRINNASSSSINCIAMTINDINDKVTFKGYNIFKSEGKRIFVNKIKLSLINQLCNSSRTTLIKPEDSYYHYPSGDYFKIFSNIHVNGDVIRITIHHPNHTVKVNDTILIYDSLNFDDIPAKYINGEHIVSRSDNDYYDILLNGVNFDTSLDKTITGGNEIKILTSNIFRIRFDYNDTFGTELGFRDVGNDTSITPYAFTISNDTLYDGEDIISVLRKSNKKYCNANCDIYNVNPNDVSIHDSIQLYGPPYILIKCREISNVENPGKIKDFFYRINLSGQLNSYVYNSYVKTPVILNDPIDHLSKLSIDIYNPDGLYYDFNGAEHSFVLEIVTLDELPEGTNIRT